MSTSPAQLRSLYRSLLRELPPRPILSSPRAPLHQRLHNQFRQQTQPPPSQRTVSQAEQYAAYLKHQRQYVALVERYNPGMGMDEEERVRLTARRVGMDLPKEFSDRIDKGNKN